MNPKVSVIVPIYNVEKYLDKCLASIRNQTLKDIEIICIDDCSPDKSCEIVLEHASNDPRIRLISHKQNLGLGGARNTGIKASNADYIASVDSDDFILPEMIQTLWDHTNEGKADIVCCGFDKVDIKGDVVFEGHYSKKIVNNTDNNINIFDLFNPNFWNKLWKKSLFLDNNIFFPEHDFFEDMPTTPRLLAKAKCIYFVEGSFYKYVTREQSITNSYSSKHIIDYFKGFEIVLSFLENQGIFSRYKAEFLEYVNNGMRFHSNAVLDSDLTGKELNQYLRHMLMLKIGFVEYRDVLKDKNTDELLELLQQDNILFLRQGIRFKKALDEKIVEKNGYLTQLETRRIDLKNAKTAVRKSENYLLESRERNVELTKAISDSKRMLEESRNRNKELSDIVSSNKKQNLELNKKNLKLEEKLSNILNPWQAMGVLIFSVVFRPFISKNQKSKLKKKPRNFFKDSKNSFTKSIGKTLKIIK